MNELIKYESATSEMTTEEINRRLRELTRRKMKLAAWIHANVKSESNRMQLLELSAHFIINERYELKEELHRRRLAQILENKIRLQSRLRSFVVENRLKQEEFRLELAKLTNERTQLSIDTQRMLKAPTDVSDKLQIMFDEERTELIKQQLAELRRKHTMRAISADASERARLRAEFIKSIKEQFDDPEAIEEAIDNYDRMVFEHLESDDDGE